MLQLTRFHRKYQLHIFLPPYCNHGLCVLLNKLPHLDLMQHVIPLF